MRGLIRQIVISLFFGGILIFSARAESSNQKFLQTKWTTENGLPQNSVTAIAQTPDGYLWLGTFGGLARFDGVRFKIYTTASTPELRSNRISAMIIDHAGTLWIETERGEIVFYKDGKFKLIDDGKEIGNATISELFADENGNLLAGDVSGLRICTRAGCQKTDFHKSVHRIRKDTDGILWMISDNLLFRFEDGKFVRENSVSDEIIALEPHPQGGFWLVKRDEFGLYQNGEYRTIGKLKNKVGYVGAFGSFSAPDGTLWLGGANDVYRVKDGKAEDFMLENVSLNTARKIFVDREGNLWLGLIGNGLIRLLNRRVETFSLESKFPQLGANSIVEDPNGSVWIATNQGLFHWMDGKFEIIHGKDSKDKDWARGSLLIDREGTLWNVTSEGLESRREGKATLRQDISWEKAQSGNSLFEDRTGNLWFGCENCGVFVSDREKIIARYTIENGLVGNVVNVVHESRDGSMWLGTRSGISRLKDGKFTHYKTEDGLSNEYVRDIYEDVDGTLWFGTYGGGLNRFRNGKFVAITTQDGLFDDIVSRILVDDDDNFWMLGNRGIYSVNRQMLNDFADGKIKQIYCNAYTTADGMITSEGNGGYQSAGTRTRDGRLWFPMINGVVIIDPKQEKLPPPKPLIEEVFLNGKEVNPANKIEAHPGNESLEINYTGLSFRKPEQIRFRYRLEGLDENWTDAGTRRLANYPYLPSGNYRFQLTAANADGVWSEQIAEFEIEVYPPFNRTWWFYILVGLMFFVSIYSAYRYRNWRFARDKAVREEFARRLLNAQETERRKIASDIHDNLGQQLLVIKNWAAYCLSKTTKTSKIRAQIVQIGETADEALNEVRLIAKTLSPYHLDKAGLTNTIRFMVKQVAESCEIDFRTEIDAVCGILPKEDEINLYRIVQESVNNIVKHSNAEHAEVILKRTENHLKLTVRDNGKGFRQDESDYQKLGMGLNGITERAKMLGGDLTIKSAPKKGTEIVLEIATK